MNPSRKKFVEIEIFICYLWMGLISCSNNERIKQHHFNSLEFTYNDVFNTCFSVKFIQSDTVYIRQHFASFFSDSLKSNTTYYTVLSHDDWMALDSFITATDFANFDTSYYESYQDGIDYIFYVQNKAFNKRVRIHNEMGPSELSSFKDWIVGKKKRWLVHQCDTIIGFKSAVFILPPEPETFKEVFVKPVVENDR